MLSLSFFGRVISFLGEVGLDKVLKDVFHHIHFLKEAVIFERLVQVFIYIEGGPLLPFRWEGAAR